jgi:hypothetical protein
MLRAYFILEADHRGGFTYGGRCQGRISIRRQMTGADFNMEADVEGGFTYGGRFGLHGGGLSFLV